LRIGVCIQSLTRVLTTATPYRGMLRELLKLRRQDEFEFYVTQDLIDESLLAAFLTSLPEDNWRLVPLPYNRRTMAVKCLAGFRDYFPIKRDVDILLTSDFDFHGFDHGPTIANLNDLSALYAPREHCSLPWHGRRMRANQARLLANSDGFVCSISQFSLRHLLEFDASFDSRSQVIHCGIDDEWHATASTTEQCRPVEEPYWIWWGQITRRKNIDGLLDGYDSLASSLNSEQWSRLPQIVCVGQVGQDSQSIRDRLSGPGRSGRVSLFPFQDLSTLISWVDQSAGVLFPSHFEGFGLPALEGLSRGKPVLTSNCTSLPEITRGNAILIDPSSVPSIASGLSRLMAVDDPAEIARRQNWAARFTYRRAAEQYSELITRLSCW